MRAIGCHIYAGGFTIGIEEAGFEVIAVLEEGEIPHLKTFRHNRPEIPVLIDTTPWRGLEAEIEAKDKEGNTHTISISEKKPNWELSSLLEPDLVYANPPCAPFSVNNKSGKHFSKHSGIGGHYSTFSLLSYFKPKALVFESVIQVLTKGGSLLQAEIDIATQLGYHVYKLKIDAQYLGLPQARRSAFVIYSKVELDFRENLPLAPPRDCLTAIEDIAGSGEPLIVKKFKTKRFKRMLEVMEPGDNFQRVFDRLVEAGEIELETHFIGEREVIKGRPSWGDKMLRPGEPTNKMAGYCWVHPIEKRFLTVPEYSRLCTYPDSWEWVAPLSKKGKPRVWGLLPQLAQGVLPKVAEAIGVVIGEGIKRGIPVKPGETYVEVVDNTRVNVVPKPAPQGDLFRPMKLSSIE